MNRVGGLKVLLIDNSILVRRVLCRALKTDSHIQHLFEASNAADGYSLFKICQPDVVVLDLDLPDIHGLEILKKIKRKAPLCAVIILTSSHAADLRDACLSCGADFFLSKGAKLGRIAEMVGDHCRSIRPVPAQPRAFYKRVQDKVSKSR